MKIQKLAYLAHGHALVESPEPLLNELFEAWKFGPVLPSLYHECKRYGQHPISNYLKDIDLVTGRVAPVPMPKNPIANEIIDFVWDAYGDEPAISLSDWTHAKDGPWYKVTNGGANILRNQDIPNEMIKLYFAENMYDDKDLFEEAAEEAATR